MHLLTILAEAEKEKRAVGHFNVSTSDVLMTIVKVARELKQPVVIGVSEGEREFIGITQIVALIRSYRNEYQLPIFLNADHTYSFDKIKQAVEAGFDAVVVDGTKLTTDENIKLTKATVDYVKANRAEVVVEGELGFIGTSSKLIETLPTEVIEAQKNLPSSEEARSFVEKTGVELLAPAVGNIHGMLKNAPDPKLNIDLIRRIRQAAGVPLVLHGGSGIANDDFVEAIEAGISLIHINTEIRVAYKEALKQGLGNDEVAPYKYLQPANEAVKTVVEQRMKLFSRMDS